MVVVLVREVYGINNPRIWNEVGFGCHQLTVGSVVFCIVRIVLQEVVFCATNLSYCIGIVAVHVENEERLGIAIPLVEVLDRWVVLVLYAYLRLIVELKVSLAEVERGTVY